ncbi:MAG: hypothetical protein ACPIOQ_54170 [Promethearchaeia archaeon]
MQGSLTVFFCRFSHLLSRRVSAAGAEENAQCDSPSSLTSRRQSIGATVTPSPAERLRQIERRAAAAQQRSLDKKISALTGVLLCPPQPDSARPLNSIDTDMPLPQTKWRKLRRF